jgi:hypothetical protein
MSVSKLQKQLLRDLKRSPGKAAVLAVLCVVAIWFWAPLLFGGGKKPAKTAKSDETIAVEAVSPAAPTTTAAVKGVSWQRLIELVESEPRMRSANLESPTEQPFGGSQPTANDLDQPNRAVAPATAEAAPDPAKFRVTSTLLGPRRRVAVINGRPYTEGEELVAGEDSQYVIARVTDRSVWLEHNGTRFELTVSRP